MNEELIKQAKECKSAEEIISLAKEKGFEMSEAEAKSYFAMLNKKNGELSDEELNAAGGTTYNCDGHAIILPSFNRCELYEAINPVDTRNCCNCIYSDGFACTIRTKDNDPVNQ